MRNICGSYLPKLPHCENFEQMAGRALYLQTTGWHVDPEEHPNYHAARQALYQLITAEIQIKEYDHSQDVQGLSQDAYNTEMEQFRQAMMEEYGERVYQAYCKLMREELMLGCVRVPAVCSRLAPDAKTKSKYGDWMICYSPVITEIPTPTTDAINTAAKLFTEALLLHKPCSVITVNFKDWVTEPCVTGVQVRIKQLCDAANQFASAEFEEKKNDAKYQHRNDWDYAKF